MKIREDRWVDLSAMFFLIAAQWCAVSRLVMTDWNDDLIIVRFVSMIGICLGILFGYSKFKPWISLLLLFIYSIVIIPWQFVTLIPRGIPLSDRVVNLWYRFLVPINEFIQNKSVKDPVLFIVFVAILFWIFSLLNGYHLIRSANPWVSIIITGIITSAIEYYDNGASFHSIYYFLFLLFALLLIGRVYHIKMNKEWQKHRIKPDTELGFHLSRTIAIGGFILILIAWNIPGITQAFSDFGSLRNSFNTNWSIFTERLSNAFTSLGNRPHIIALIYGNQMNLGTSSPLSEEVMFRVEVNDNFPPEESIAGRYYWLAHSYDHYKDSLWSTTDSETKEYYANETPFMYPKWIGRETINLSIFAYQPAQGTIFTPTYPIKISRPINSVIRTNPDGTTEVLGIMGNPPLRAGDSYQLQAIVSAPTARQLLEAGSNYPTWITDFYLQLPDNLPDRMYTLAHSLAEGNETPYEITLAVTNYLREEITYQESIDPPPVGREPLDWFLFEYKTGFCNYYASSEVLLLRMNNIPARLAIGYAEGSSNQERTSFIVRAKNSHAWVEVYFPEIGWVEFEPTSSQPSVQFPEETEIDLSALNNPTPSSQPSPVPSQTPQAEDDKTSDDEQKLMINTTRLIWGLGIGVIVLTILAIAIYWYFTQKNKHKHASIPLLIVDDIKSRGYNPPKWLSSWANYTRLQPIERQFMIVSYINNLYRIKPDGELTPSEQVSSLISVIPQTEQPANNLLSAYEISMYSPNPVISKKTSQYVRYIMWAVVRDISRKIFSKMKSNEDEPHTFWKE